MESSVKSPKGHHNKATKEDKSGHHRHGHGHQQPQQLETQSEFFARLASIPLVSAALSLASNLYTKAKESVWLFGRVSDVCESSVKLALGLLNPVLQQISPFAAAPLAKVDNIASQGLATLERAVPAIKMQPAQMVQGTKELITEKTRPTVDKLNHVSDTVLGSLPLQLSMDVVEKLLSSSSAIVNNVLPAAEEKSVFPHEKEPEDKTARATWLFRESFYLVVSTTKRVFGIAQFRVTSAAHSAENAVESLRNL